MQSKATSTSPVQRSDPYRDWLGITSSERPPNHYQLLGLTEFEKDSAKIAAAFENRFGNVRRYQVGARAEEAGQLLQRLSSAYAELSDERRKADYDATLSRREAGHDSETLHDVGITESDTGKIDGSRPPHLPPQLPPRASPATVDSEKEIADGEIVSDEATAAVAEPIVKPEVVSDELGPEGNENAVPIAAVYEAERAEGSEESSNSQAASSDQLGVNLQSALAKEAGSMPAFLRTRKASRAKAKRRKALRVSLAKANDSAAPDPDRISGVERLQVSVLALFVIFPVVLVGLLLIFVAPVALVLVSAVNFVAWLALCVLWFLRDGWRTLVRSLIRGIVQTDRMIGVALGEDNKIIHNFVRVAILIVALAAGLALLASCTGILL